MGSIEPIVFPSPRHFGLSEDHPNDLRVDALSPNVICQQDHTALSVLEARSTLSKNLAMIHWRPTMTALARQPVSSSIAIAMPDPVASSWAKSSPFSDKIALVPPEGNPPVGPP